MKKLISAIVACAFLCGATADAKDAKRNIRKSGNARGTPVDVSVDIGFSGQYGYTATDSLGTRYNFFGYSFYEDKVYPPEYWGVFPLYFFGTEVGVAVAVKNNSADQDASLRVSTECYCLRTDGSDGAALLLPSMQDVFVPKGSTVTLDGSFIGDAVEGAESGLDRFLVKVYSADTVTYQVVSDADNKIKFENAPVGLGEDGAKQTDTFVIYVDGAIPADESPAVEDGSGIPLPPPFPASMTVKALTKAGTGRAETVLTGDGASAEDGLGFRITLVSSGPEGCVMKVSSESNSHALSHVEFVFIDGAQVGSPTGSYDAERETLEGGESTLILVKEGVFCPPELDAEASGVVESVLGK